MCRRDIGEPKTSIEEIVSLATFSDLSTLKMSFREGVADTFVRSVGPTEMMFEAVCEYRDRSGIRTIRLLKAPTLLVLHDFTSHDFRWPQLLRWWHYPRRSCNAVRSRQNSNRTAPFAKP